MQITIAVSDELVREAGAKGLTVVDYVELLIDKGLAIPQERSAMAEAIERIRVLSGKTDGKK